MTKNPEVSIIMNCRNGEKYLSQSLSSIINQSYRNWELIFWNNSSTDKSKKIFKDYNEKRFRYFENKKVKKLYDVRNLAIKKAKGNYISFLDTDDLWIRDKLKTQIKFIKKKKSNFIFSNYYVLNGKKKEIFYKKDLPSGNITNQLLKHNCIGILTVLMKKSLFSKYKFNSKYNIIGDYDYFIRLSLLTQMFSLKKPLAYYRIHSSNFSKIKLETYYSELNQWLYENNKFLKNNNLDVKSINFFKIKLLTKIFIIKIKKLFFYNY